MIEQDPDLDYVIVVPSRRRVHNMPVLRSLLPTAVVTVDETELADYSGAVPDDKLVPHPTFQPTANGGVVAMIRNWVLEQFDNDIVVFVDDDFVGIQTLFGSRRRIVHPEEILGVLENAARNTRDLGLSCFCFCRTANALQLREHLPIVPTQMVAACFGIMGPARRRKYDPQMGCRADLDWSMTTLLEDRCVYADVRFYFDVGLSGAGAGGGVGLVTPRRMEASSALLRKKWGKHLSEPRSDGRSNLKRGKRRMNMRVRRSNPRAVK